MTRKRGRKLMICIAVVALLAGAAAAVVTAAAPATHHRRGTLATAAAYLGLNRTRLRSELHAGKTLAAIANATPGRSSAGLIEALEAAQKQKLASAAASLSSRISAEVNGAHGPAAAARGEETRAAIAYLGISHEQLRTELRSGKTLAQIADASSGKSEAGLIEALVAAKKTAIVASVKAGTITQAQAESREGKLVSRVRARVQRTRRARTALRRTRGARPALRG
jgi:hypothetical protein